MRTIEIVLSGAAGRLGRRIIALALNAPDLRISHGLEHAGSDLLGTDLGLLAGAPREIGVKVTAKAAEAIRPDVVVIEAATRAAALEHAELAAQARAPMLIATTGFDQAELKRLEQCQDRIPLLIAPNLSLGITVLLDLVARASRALDGYQLELVEMHHNKKRDAPSGTAWALARAAAIARGQDVEEDAILARAGDVGPRGEHEIGMQSLRGGDIVGEHTLYLIGDTERIELSHRAATRDAFAAGAIRAARFLGEEGRRPGHYTMRDVLGLDRPA